MSSDIHALLDNIYFLSRVVVIVSFWVIWLFAFCIFVCLFLFLFVVVVESPLLHPCYESNSNFTLSVYYCYLKRYKETVTVDE